MDGTSLRRRSQLLVDRLANRQTEDGLHLEKRRNLLYFMVGLRELFLHGGYLQDKR